MAYNKRFFYVFICIFYFFTITSSQSCYNDQWYSIRSTTGGLTIDASEPAAVKIQYFDGRPRQQWKFECGDSPNSFFIVSNYTGNVLDVVRSGSHYLTVSVRDNSVYQQWILNSNGRIVNVGLEQNVDIENGYFIAGERLWTYQDNDTPAQEYILQDKI